MYVYYIVFAVACVLGTKLKKNTYALSHKLSSYHGLHLLVGLSNTVAYPAGFTWRDIEGEAEQQCNAE